MEAPVANPPAPDVEAIAGKIAIRWAEPGTFEQLKGAIASALTAHTASLRERVEELERALADAEETLVRWHETNSHLAKVDAEERGRQHAHTNRMREALEGACEQILDSYRTWVADDIEAHPRPGQIPRYDAARAALSPTTPTVDGG